MTVELISQNSGGVQGNAGAANLGSNMTQGRQSLAVDWVGPVACAPRATPRQVNG